jgi:serine/threonine protein kinase
VEIQVRGAKVVLKRLKSTGQKYTNELLSEAKVWKHLTHPCIVQFLGVYQQGTKPKYSGALDNVILIPGLDLYLCCEYLPGGDLESYVRNNNLSLEEMAQIALSVAAGMKYLASNDIVHRGSLLLLHQHFISI